MTTQIHYGNRYATIVGLVHKHGRISAKEIREKMGLPHRAVGVYLTRAVQRGHIYRPERGVYSTEGPDPTGHWHGACEHCAQPEPMEDKR